MPRTPKSQWDFGELFPKEATRKVLTVAELTTSIRRLLEKEIGAVWVTGEVTNLRAQSSGHLYFTLKDATAQLNCVLFRSEAAGARDVLKDGTKVVLHGDLTVYEPRGQYQLRVTEVELQGVGALQLAFEKLKQKLNTAGLFAAERKRPLPRFPQRLGLVTSPTGAAIRDVLHVIQRRQPGLEIIFVPCRVQGQGAAEEIAAAIGALNEWSVSASEPLDLILVTRGGGSLEDLWAFNEEIMARAIFESRLPVVSAVGHEIDFTISDFVADFRAATPSAAAELITEGVFASRQFVAEAPARLRLLAQRQIATSREEFEQLARRLARSHPRRQLREQLQNLDDWQTRLLRCARQTLRQHHGAWLGAGQRLLRLKPAQLLAPRRQVLRELTRRLREQTEQRRQAHASRLATLAARLRLLAPQNVLERGYSITTDAATGRILRAAGESRPGQRLRTRLSSGEIRSRVEE